MKFLTWSLFLSLFCCSLYPQHIELLANKNKISIRGLSVVNDKVIWVSGNHGTVGKSTDSGRTWQWTIVENFQERDFRDIEAFDEDTAIVMAVAEPAIILKTNDGGKTWRIVFSDSTKGMFLDAMDFVDHKHGVVIGDPMNKKVFLAYTENQGEKWEIDYGAKLFDAEALFASSGSNIKMVWDKELALAHILFVTGGKKSRLFINDKPHDINLIQGLETQGANSITLNSKTGKGIIVGGDFSKDSFRENNCVLFALRNTPHFAVPSTAPHGYRSCVEYIAENKFICCGTSGVDISEDGGLNWSLISKESFHVCQKAKIGNSVWLAGVNGKIARLIW